MLKITVTGAAGRMGRTIIKVVAEDKEAQIVGAVEKSDSPYLGNDAGELSGIGRKLNVPVQDNLEKALSPADVLIDFTSPSETGFHIKTALRKQKALVIGTTGVGEEDKKLLLEAGKKIPVIWAPNFSVGVNLIAKLTRIAAEVLGKGFDPEIVEAHHRMKKDSPSGTAIKLLNVLKDVYKTDDVVYGREGLIGERPGSQIGVFAVRGGDVAGEHTVSFFGDGERVEIVHKASSRETFARGALRAAKYIVKKGPGIYTMEDVLGL